MALAATLVGFGFLVVALVTGTLWLAIACIVVCIIGGLFLLADLLGLGETFALRRRRPVTADDVDTGESGVEIPADAATSDPDPSDAEVTTEFPRIETEEPVVSLDDPDRVEPVRHGRHESGDAAHGPARPPRHGTPE